MLTKLFAVPWYGLAALTGIAAAQSSATIYDSAYAGYAPYREEPLASWRAVNEDVARTGGHAGIFGGAMHQGNAPQKPSDATAGTKPTLPVAPAPPHGREHQ